MKQIADFLKSFREKKGLTEDFIVKKTTLTKTVIHLIETGDFKSIGAEFYIKSFLRQYCIVIGLTEEETEEIIAKVINSLKEKNKTIPLSNQQTKKNPFKYVFMFVVILLFGFLMFKSCSLQRKYNKREVEIKSVLSSDNKIKKTQTDNNNKEPVDKLKKDKVKELKINDNNKITTKGDKIPDYNAKSKQQIRPLESENNMKVDATADIEKNHKKIKVDFKAKCMCWVNIVFNNKVLKDFILKPDENYSVEIPEGSLLTVGDANCVEVFFNGKKIELGEQKVVRNIQVE